MTRKHLNYWSSAQWVVFGATALAAFLRIYLFDTLPPSAWWDEIWYGLRARDILETGQLVVHYETNFGGANSGPVYMTVLAHLLGFDTPAGGRIIPAFVGTLSIPLAFVCFKHLFRYDKHLTWTTKRTEWTAALTSVVLSYTLFYTTIARIGMENPVAPGIAIFVIWQLARAIDHGNWHNWIIAGLVAGGTQYNGLHVRFMLPLLLIFFVLKFLTASWKQRIWMLKGGVVFSILGVLASLPLTLFFINNPEWFTARAEIVSNVGPGQRFETIQDMYRYNFRMISRVFFIEGSYDPKNGIPGIPLLDPIQAAGFVFGIVISIGRRWRSTMTWFVLFWLIWMCTPSYLTEGAPNLGRMIGIAPPTAALVAIGWVDVSTILRRQPNLPHLAYRIALPMLVVGSSIYHIWLLFVQWPQVSNLREQFTAEPVETANLLIDRAQEQPVFVGAIPEMQTPIVAFDFLFPETSVHWFDLRQCLPLPHQRTEPTTYLIVDGRDPQTVELLKQAYPELEVQRSGIDLWQTTGTLMQIPAEAEAPVPQVVLNTEFGAGITLRGFDWTGPQVRPGDTLLVTTYWHATEPIAVDYTAFAHIGTGLTEAEPIIAQRDAAPCLGLYPSSRWHPGDQVPDGFAIQIPEDATPGVYPVSVGWYEWPSLTPLPIIEEDNTLPGERAILGEVEVVSGE